MTKRAGLVAFTAALLVAQVAEAKLITSFSERDVAPGDRVRVDLGVDAGRFLTSLRQPRLTIRRPTPGESGASYTPALFGVVPLALAAGLVLWRRRQPR